MAIKLTKTAIMNYLATVILMIGCISSYQQRIKIEDVKKIEIDGVPIGHNVLEKISLTDSAHIDSIVTEINRMRPLDTFVSLKNNFGEYTMDIELKNGSIKRFMITYTTYSGVVIQGSGRWGITLDKYYKNDRLEMLVSRIFHHK
jgi:hypothetical protein